MDVFSVHILGSLSYEVSMEEFELFKILGEGTQGTIICAFHKSKNKAMATKVGIYDVVSCVPSSSGPTESPCHWGQTPIYPAGTLRVF